MNEELPVPYQHCKSTGLSTGVECRECRGKGYRVFVRGALQPVPRAEAKVMAGPTAEAAVGGSLGARLLCE